jgi:hypothetical protein
MSLIRKTLAWLFVNQISETTTPLEFLQFQEAITKEADRQKLRYSVTEPMSEQKIRNLVVETIGRSLQTNPKTLPSVASEISIEGEQWHVILTATSIPHFRASVVQSEPMPRSDSKCQVGLVRQLVEQDEIDYCILGDDRLYGKTWRLYLHCKIRLLKPLRELYSQAPFRMVPVLLPPDEVFPQLADGLPQKTILNDNPADVRTFLDECDRVLTAHFNEQELSAYLQKCSVSLPRFLRAQHSAASKVRALF